MNHNHMPPFVDERLLAALMAVNPPLEKLMADRLAIRKDMRQAQDELERIRLHLIPEYLGIVKATVLVVAAIALVALAAALFKGVFEVRVTATLFIALLLPIWVVDQAEARFGRWVFGRIDRAEYAKRRESRWAIMRSYSWQQQ